ncbi:DMT family transporter [Roseomonas sp. CCTCC AB2023176]|uniref:DMT family transporter n=1 Tax=Roseomonas sp. CCTCC AB2023176 TaxID=3342640 RepID=UPI0035DA8812
MAGPAPTRAWWVKAAWIGAALLTSAAFPVITRLGVTAQGLSPLQITTLRYAVAALVLGPLLLRGRRLGAAEWREGAILAVLQGTPLALLVAGALVHVHAAHGAALGLGLMPVMSVILGLFLGTVPSRRAVAGVLLIAGGATALAGLEAADGGEALIGYAMFCGSAFLGASYFARLKNSGFSAIEGAAFVAVFSGAGGVLALAATGGFEDIAALPSSALALQVGFQGFVVGVGWLVAVNRTICLLGAAPATVCLSLTPAITAALAFPVLGEVPPLADALAMAVMVAGAVIYALRPEAENRNGAAGAAPPTPHRPVVA